MNHLNLVMNWNDTASLLQFKSSDDDDHRRDICCEIKRQLGKRGYIIFKSWLKSEGSYTPEFANAIWENYSAFKKLPHFKRVANSKVHEIITASNISSQVEKIALIYIHCRAIRHLRKLYNPPNNYFDLSQCKPISDALKEIARLELMVRNETEEDWPEEESLELDHQSPDSTDPVILR